MDQSWLDLKGKVVIVTGGASGIGKHITEQLKVNKAKVAVADLNVTTEAIADHVLHVQCDVTSQASVEQMVDKVVAHYGQVDVLVNNAGVNLPRLLVDSKGEKPEYELDEKAFDLMINVNQKGPYLCAQAVTRHFVK